MRLPSGVAVIAAAAWRQAWRVDDILRQRIWSADLGFPLRPTPSPGSVAAVESVAPRRAAAPGVRATTVAAVSATTTNASAFSEAAACQGLTFEADEPGAAAALLGRALDSRLPLVCIAADGLTLTSGATPLVERYLRDGGMVLLTARSPSAAPVLDALEAQLGLRLPGLRDSANGDASATFAGARPDFVHELAGMRVSVVRPAVTLTREAGQCVIAWSGHDADTAPLAVEIGVGKGRLLIAVGSAAPAPTPTTPNLDGLVATMAMRSLFGPSGWHSPYRLANLTVDDPALRTGLLGLDFPRLVAEADSLDFHVTVATIPRELGLAEPAVLALLADKPDRLSACYHGNDHSGYEFYASPLRRVRFRSRPLARQRRALELAVERVGRFTELTGARLDQVMVFPHGLCPAELLPVLGELGFLATCNWLDRYPLDAPVPPDHELGRRPADLAWSGFPLLWRRPLSDSSGVLDLFYGRPAILFCHRHELDAGIPDSLRARVHEINQAGGGTVAWRGLEEVARHAYLQRRLDSDDWEVLMTANEACLHNPGSGARTFRVSRPHLPAGAGLEAESALEAEAQDSEGITVTVASNATATVRVKWPSGASLPGRRRPCSIGSG